MILKKLAALAFSALLLGGALAPTVGAVAERAHAPSGAILLDDDSVLYADVYNKAIFSFKGAVSTRLAGRTGSVDAYDRPSAGYHDGAALLAAFASPWDITPYLNGYAISDTDNHVLRYLADGTVSTLAGTGKSGSSNGSSTKASFARPTGLASMEDGSLLVADTDNHRIRHVDIHGTVSSFAGSSEGCRDGAQTSAQLREPTGLYYANGVLYIADSGNNRICKVENGQLSTVVGSKTGEEGFLNGTSEKALLSAPQDMHPSADGALYISDTGNGALRMLRDGYVTTLAYSGSSSASIPAEPRAILPFGQELLVGDVFTHRLLHFPLPTARSFADVTSADWFFASVQRASLLGLVSGTSDAHFSPDGSVSRAMAITVLSRLETAQRPYSVISGQAQFADVPAGLYYSAPAAWAKAQSIAGGDGARFSPDASITRADLATLLYRYAKQSGVEVTKQADLTQFADHASIPSYATQSVSWACASGLLTGKSTTQLDPTAALTRAELATIALRYLSMV